MHSFVLLCQSLLPLLFFLSLFQPHWFLILCNIDVAECISVCVFFMDVLLLKMCPVEDYFDFYLAERQL